MKVTRTWIATNFTKFNKEYFNNALPTPNFQICMTYRMLGQCGAKNWRSIHPNFTIKISNYFERSEHEYQNTLIHEMIHLYFQSNGDWKEGHGRKFQRMARSFDKCGWNIHTTEQGFKPKMSGGTIPTRLVLTFEDNDTHKTWICCVANDVTKIRKFQSFIQRSTRYSNPNLYSTNSEKFASFKISHTRLGGKVVDKATLDRDWMPLLKVKTLC